MGHALLAYSAAAAAAGATNTDFLAATDADFTQRNSHYQFTESYRLAKAVAVGASLTRGRVQVPSWNAFGEFQLFGANRSASVPSNPQWDDWRLYPPPIPQMEEFQVQWSNNLGAATEVEQAAIVIVSDDWTTNLPRGRMPILVRASFTVTPTVQAWSGPQTLTISPNLRGGVYAVCGAVCQGANSAFFRLIFPRYKLYSGRKLRPGGLIQNAVGDTVSNNIPPWVFDLGEWGRFHTFELVQAEVFGITASSTTYQLFLWLIYLGESLDYLNAGLAGGM